MGDPNKAFWEHYGLGYKPQARYGSKMGQFIGKVNSILQEFYYLSDAEIVNLINTYATSFHGFCLWYLYSKECDRLYNSWNVALRQVHKVPNTNSQVSD